MERRYENITVDDRTLIDGCRKKDRRSQELLYRKYARQMFHVCMSYTGDRDEAKDILQESFLKVYRNLDTYRDSGPLEGWIRRIVSNTAIDFYRSSKRLGYFIPVEEARDIAVADPDHTEIRLEAGEVFEAIGKLPEGARVVFQLFAVEGYSHKEIARKLQISESTSKSQYQRARSLLMEKMTKRQAG